MNTKAVVPRRQANRDVEDALDYYLREASDQVALGFIDALENAYRTIARHPAGGSQRYAHELGLAGLSSQRRQRYPYVIFYIERDDHIDIWRVLHGHRDIAPWLADLGDD